MRARVFFLCGALAGCGVLTGLDGLKVQGDASSTSDASDEGDAIIDGGTPDANEATVTTGMVHCGANACSGGQICCISVSNGQPLYSCVKDCNGGTAALTLRCDDLSDCNGQLCCLSNNVAQCGSGTTTCPNELCANDQQCSAGGKCLPFDAGDGVTLQHCQ